MTHNLNQKRRILVVLDLLILVVSKNNKTMHLILWVVVVINKINRKNLKHKEMLLDLLVVWVNKIKINKMTILMIF